MGQIPDKNVRFVIFRHGCWKKIWWKFPNQNKLNFSFPHIVRIKSTRCIQTCVHLRFIFFTALIPLPHKKKKNTVKLNNSMKALIAFRSCHVRGSNVDKWSRPNWRGNSARLRKFTGKVLGCSYSLRVKDRTAELKVIGSDKHRSFHTTSFFFFLPLRFIVPRTYHEFRKTIWCIPNIKLH